MPSELYRHGDENASGLESWDGSVSSNLFSALGARGELSSSIKHEVFSRLASRSLSETATTKTGIDPYLHRTQLPPTPASLYIQSHTHSTMLFTSILSLAALAILPASGAPGADLVLRTSQTCSGDMTYHGWQKACVCPSPGCSWDSKAGKCHFPPHPQPTPSYGEECYCARSESDYCQWSTFQLLSFCASSRLV